MYNNARYAHVNTDMLCLLLKFAYQPVKLNESASSKR